MDTVTGCRTCRDEVYLPDDTLCSACVCSRCRTWQRERRLRAAVDPLDNFDGEDRQECADPGCGWARAMGTAV